MPVGGTIRMGEVEAVQAAREKTSEFERRDIGKFGLLE